MRSKKFQTNTVSFRDVYKMSISDRVSLAKSSRGSNLLSALTPEQYAALFPKFYLKSLPDIGGFQAAMTPEGKRQIEGGRGGSAAPFRTDAQRRREALDSALPLRRDIVPTSIRRLEERTGVKISDPGAKAQLSEEKRKVLELMKQGAISSDDPRVSFVSRLTEEDRRQAGIETVKSEDGKTSFRMLPVEITRDEIEAEHKKATSKLESGNFNQQSPIIMNRLMKDLNITREQAAGIIGNLAHESAGLQAGIQEKRPLAGRGGLGWAQWTGPRRRDFESYLERTGQSHTDPEANYGFLIEELKGKEKAALERLRRASSVDDATLIFERAYERAGIKHDEARRSYARRSMDLYDPDTGTAGDGTQLTDEKIQEIENRLKKRRQLNREKYLAERTIPDLPQGLDPNIVKYYETLKPGQRQQFIQALRKDGEETDDPIASGAAKLNEAFKADPQNTQLRIQAGVSQQGSGNLGFSDETIAARAEQLSDIAKISLEKFKVFAPGGTTVTSTYRSPSHPIEASKNTPGAHARGKAIDIRTRGRTKDELAATVQALKKAGFNHVLLEGDHIHAEIRPSQRDFAVTNLGRGNPNIDLDTARSAASAAEFNVALSESEEKRRQEIVEQEKTTSEQRPIEQRGLLSYTGQARSTTEQVAVATQEPVANTATPVPVLADGGTVKTDDDSITAYPISDLKGDNSLVVDSKNKPLFTMNTNKESANFDPNTGNVTVNPESVNRNNPDSLTPPKETNSREEEQTPGVTQMSRSQPPISQSQPSDNSAIRERMIMSTVSPFTCPSFKRAISESNFKRTSSDGVGVGHFDQNNYSLK